VKHEKEDGLTRAMREALERDEPRRWAERNRASGEPAARAAERLIGFGESHVDSAEDTLRRAANRFACATVQPMATLEEKLLEEAEQLLAPLVGPALVAMVDVIRLLVKHPDGAELAAKRNAQALAAEAFIRS